MPTQRVLEMSVLNDCLRAQNASTIQSESDFEALIEDRNLSGSGFLTRLKSDGTLRLLPDHCHGDFNCVRGQLNDDPQRVDFIVMFEAGVLKWIEGFNYAGDAWPSIETFALFPLEADRT